MIVEVSSVRDSRGPVISTRAGAVLGVGGGSMAFIIAIARMELCGRGWMDWLCIKAWARTMGECLSNEEGDKV